MTCKLVNLGLSFKFSMVAGLNESPDMSFIGPATILCSLISKSLHYVMVILELIFKFETTENGNTVCIFSHSLMN